MQASKRLNPSPLWPALSLAALALIAHAPAVAAPHEHGVVNIDAVIEAQKVTFQLRTPLDNILGFERAPRNESEKKGVTAVLNQFKLSQVLFQIDPAGGCKPGPVALESAALKLNSNAPVDGKHADLSGSFVFNCTQAAAVKHIDLALFGPFPRIQRLEVQVVTPKAQLKRSLKRPNKRLSLTP